MSANKHLDQMIYVKISNPATKLADIVIFIILILPDNKHAASCIHVNLLRAEPPLL